MKRAILFDYGGTLDGAGSHWFDRFVDLYRQLRVARPREEIRAAFYAAEEELLGDPRIRGWNLDETLRRHVAIQLGRLGLEDRQLANRLRDGFLVKTRAGWQESSRVLSVLAPSFALAVVSNFYGNLDLVLRQAGLRGYFAAAVDSEVVGLRKPDQRIFEAALQRLGSPAELATFVGDSFERDMVPAKHAGMRTVWLAGAEKPAPAAGCVDWRVGSLSELEGLPL